MKKSTIKEMFVNTNTNAERYKIRFLLFLNKNNSMKNIRYKIVALEIDARKTKKKLAVE